MSIEIMNKAWRVSLPPAEKLILISLADQANDNGVTWPSVSSIVTKTGMSERTIFRHLSKLEELGHIRREHRMGSSTIYHVHPCQNDTPVKLTPLTLVTPTPDTCVTPPLTPVSPTPATVGRQNHQESSLNHQRTTSLQTASKKPKSAEAKASSVLNVSIWESYSKAYFHKYGVDPVRNATVNGQIAQLGKRLGSDAVHVAGWFLNHNNSWYSQKMHSVGALLADAEKLRTEWATNKQMTQTKARSLDQSAGSENVFVKLMREGKI